MFTIHLGQRQPRDRAVHVFGNLLHFDAGLRDLDARTVAIHEAQPQLLLQPAQRLAHGGLRQMQFRRRATHAAFFRNGEKSTQQVPVEAVVQISVRAVFAHDEPHWFHHPPKLYLGLELEIRLIIFDYG